MKLDVKSGETGVKALTLELSNEEWDELRASGRVVGHVDMRGDVEVTVVLPFMKGERKVPRQNDPKLR